MGRLLSPLILLTSIASSTSASALPSTGSSSSSKISSSLPNANYIFNTIQDSMRQWGSSLHHNGMSFFLATVPAGTQFYHGDALADPVTGTEWLAFEPEHAMVFARPHRGPPSDEKPDEDHKDGHGYDHGMPPPPPKHDMKPQDMKEDGRPLLQKPLHKRDDEDPAPGWLHTYIAAKDLRLLYLDGMSGAKTQNGTLDAQDRILFNDTLDQGEGKGMFSERERADTFCKMAHEIWDDRLDGLIRMEAGFEIILCSFERDLKEVRVTQVKPSSKEMSKKKGPGGPGSPGGPPGPPGMPGSGSWMKAITARYAGIGGDRVRLNMDKFVSAYNYNLDLFNDEIATKHLPRLSNIPSAELTSIREDLSALILTHTTTETSFNWQGVTDMIIERYGHQLAYLSSSSITTLSQLHEELDRVLGPFIDYSARNIIIEADRCANQFIPAHAPTDGLAASAIQSVALTICQGLLKASEETDLSSAVEGLEALVDWLNWAKWKDCRGCKDNEICVIPIWPMGTVEDYNEPKCRDARNPDSTGESYWGRRGPPGGRKKEKEEL